MKPILFVGSSVKALPYARALQKNLQYEAMVRLWPQGIFLTGQFPLESLLAALDDADFGAFIFQPEDILIMKGEKEMAVRDNVLFELGMFIGRLGRERSFFIKPLGEELHLPSDLVGVTAAEFDPTDPNKIAGMGSASSDILDRINDVGPRGGPAKAPEASLPGYDRGAALEAAIAASNPKPLVHGTKYTRNEVINAAGDAWIVERFEEVEGISADPVTQIPTSYKSLAGRTNIWRCESQTPNQDVSCTWLDPDGTAIRRGAILLTPGIAKGRAISFKMERNVLNAIAFTKRVRRDVTGGQAAEESISIGFRHIYDSCLMQVTFPDRHFPQRFRITAYTPSGARDDAESAFAEKQVTEFRETRNLLLQLPSPLPGFKYEVNWELPDDETGVDFDPVQSGFVDEMTRRLLGLRLVDRLLVEDVKKALASIRALLLGPVADEPTEVTLYVYDRQKSALACVASLDAEAVEKAWASYVFKPGRGIAGFAFRERQTIIYRREEGEKSPQTDRYELVLNEDPAMRPSCMICVPLFYAGRRGRCVGVLSIASRQTPSKLAALAFDPAAPERMATAAESWYATELAEALGVISTSRFWRIVAP